MRLIDLIHRWTGGLIGLLLAVMGLSGAVLVYKDSWVLLPHAADPQRQDVESLATAVTRLVSEPETRFQSIQFATRDFGLHRLRFDGEAGAYAEQGGAIVTGWASKWDRVELWLFDFHHYLWMGKTGAVVAGWLALIGIGFVVTGLILWWPYRKKFKPRPWPARLSRPSILHHHRDLGVVLAPLLLISMVTGAMLTLRPLSNLLLSPISSPDEMAAAMAPPSVRGGALDPALDWHGLLTRARDRFPDAEFRSLSLPRKDGDLIALRMRQPAEWLPNGRSMVWFDPADGRLIETRDALRMPQGSRIFNMLYPLHAAKVGGFAYKLAMTLSGLGLCLLGAFTVWTFWFRRPKLVRKAVPVYE